MKTKYINHEIRYDGSQLSSHFAYKNFNLLGNSIIAFCGPVEVSLSEMVDIEDVIKHEPIASDRMLSFIVEAYDIDLAGTVWMQRLLMAIIQDELNHRLVRLAVIREGDDLYINKNKLSVSIATASPVSTMIHAALNVKGTGAPISISSLEEIGIEEKSLGEAVLKRFAEEFEDVEFARKKVRWVI